MHLGSSSTGDHSNLGQKSASVSILFARLGPNPEKVGAMNFNRFSFARVGRGRRKEVLYYSSQDGRHGYYKDGLGLRPFKNLYKLHVHKMCNTQK